MNRDRERQTHHHPTRIGLNRLTNEITDFGEGLDFRETAIHLLGGKTQNGAVQINVIASGKFRIEPGTQLQKRRDASGDIDRAGSGLQNTRADLQKSAFARAVLSDDAERFASLNFE